MQILDHIRSLQRFHKKQSWIRACAQEIKKFKKKKKKTKVMDEILRTCARHVHNKHTYKTKPKYLTKENLRYK